MKRLAAYFRHKKQLFIQLFNSLSTDNYYGDIPLLKAELLNLKTKRTVATQDLVTDGRQIDLATLLSLPEDTFGHQYASFLKAKGLTPFTASEKAGALASKRSFVARQMIVHDFLHVTLGFDTTYSGEIGVFAFLVSQNFTRWQKYNLLSALFVYPIMAPKEVFKIYRNTFRGYRLGRKSQFALEFPFEKYWTVPLTEVRSKLIEV